MKIYSQKMASVIGNMHLLYLVRNKVSSEDAISVSLFG